MKINRIIITGLLASGAASAYAENNDVDNLKNNLKEYENKIKILEQRLDALQSQVDEADENTQQLSIDLSQQGNKTAANTFNPGIGLVLNGRYQQLPNNYQFSIPGFFLGDEVGVGESGFLLGESELSVSANADDKFYGSMTLAFGDEAGVEEAFLQTIALPAGTAVKFGRFLSGIGYLNSHHSHTDDFANRPLAYQAFLGNSFTDDGVQLSWLAPTSMYWESGIEWYRGDSFPAAGAAHSGKGVSTFFTHIGDDINRSQSWRAGISFLQGKVIDRSSDVGEIFSGDTQLLLADAVWKWAPDGNTGTHNAKLQAEYFQRTEKGDFTNTDAITQPVVSDQNGWYVQGIYQFMPQWRFGIRYEKLTSVDLPNTFSAAVLDNLNHNPQQTSVMLDWTNSEFSRVRLQFSRDNASQNPANIWTLQYTAAFGAHGAHSF